VELRHFSFGTIEVDGTTYDHDLVIDGGRVRKRSKGPSKKLRERYGHTPLSIGEDIPWDCDTLVVGTGASGSLPVTEDVVREAERRGVRLVMVPTAEALERLEHPKKRTNAILHLTC